MSKYRIYDIAKELNTDNKTILGILHKNNIEAKSHSSTVDDNARQVVIKALQSQQKPQQTKANAKQTAPKPQNDGKPQTPAKAQKPQQSHTQQPQAGKQEKNHREAGGNAHSIRERNDNKNRQGRNNGEQHNAADNQKKHNGSQQERRNDRHQHNNGGNSHQNDRQKPVGDRPKNNSNRPERNDRNDRNGSGHNDNRNEKKNNRDNRMERTDRMDRNDRNRQNGGRNDRNGKNGRNNFNNNGFGGKNNRNKNNRNKNTQQQAPKMEIARPKNIKVGETIIVKDLASKMSCTAAEIIKKLMLMGVLASINQEIDFDTAALVASEFGVNVEELPPEVDPTLIPEIVDDPKTLVLRPPVVTVMGHVDHGKTSLLDVIRKTSVSTHEAGGITQHIGAYQVKCQGKKIVFLDTPGHEAFTAMRARGAQVTDIAILVVAADDGVMPQTVEAINHAKAAGISIIVAVNKIDKPSANIDKVKQELAEYELVAEDWGGDTVFVPVSAHTKEGIDQLLEMILLTAEMCELKANPNRKARGLVLEAKLDKGRGTVATVLVQKGTLKVGDAIAAGSCYGRVRAMINDKGEKIKEATPSTPVEILGLNSVPNAGEIFVATKNEKEARSFADTFISEGREKLLEGSKAKSKMSLDDLFSQIQAGDVKELNIIVKADVQGSVEAVKQSLVKLSNDEVVVKVIHGGVGAINESDVILASASNAIIIGFNVRPDNQAKDIAERENVDLRLYRVIYQAIEDVEAAMKGMLDPVYEEKVIGHAEVRQLFKASGVGTIAGSYVLDGMFQRGCKVRITREGEQIFEGPLASLKRFKDDVKEVKAGYECGLVFEGFNDLQELDLVEAYIMVEVPR